MNGFAEFGNSGFQVYRDKAGNELFWDMLPQKSKYDMQALFWDPLTSGAAFNAVGAHVMRSSKEPVERQRFPRLLLWVSHAGIERKTHL